MYKSRLRNSKERTDRQKPDGFIMEDGFEYGFINQMLGNGRCNIFCEDGKERMGRIRGSLRKYRAKVIISNFDLVAITRRDYEDDKVDVIHKFTHEDASKLLYKRKLPEKIMKCMEKSHMSSACGIDNAELDHIVFEVDELDINEI